MSKKIVTYVLTLAMIFSVFSNPALGYATTEADASDVTNTTAVDEPSNDESTNVESEEPSDDAEQTDDETVTIVGTVTNLKASATSHNTISLKWSKTEGADGYQVYRYSKTRKAYIRIKTVNTNKFSNSKLLSGTAYTYKVRAFVTEGEEIITGEFSETVKCKTLPYVAKVTGYSVKADSAKAISLKWKKVSGAKGYQVYRYSKTKGKYIRVKTVTKNSYKNTGLKAYSQYIYKVRAYKVQDGKKYYGPFSAVKKCRTERTDPDKIKTLAYSKRNGQYKWGATGPNKFDCSGFVYWVYEHADVKVKKAVPDTNSAGQYAALKKYMIGKSVKSIGKAKTGDIIFFKYGGRVSHVGIYYGNGKMIHAANPRKDICIEKVKDYDRWGYKVVGIARVL